MHRIPSDENRRYCKALRRICRKCGNKFTVRDTFQHCPTCGEDRTCNKPTVPNFNFCAAHGGPKLSRGFYGKESFVSRFPLAKLAERYSKMQHDARLLSNRASIAVVRERIRQLATRIDINDAPDRMAKLIKLWEEFREAENDNRTTDSVTLKRKIDKEFNKAYADYESWRQMFEAIDLDRKLVESEVKVVKEIKSILTAEDAYELVAKLLAVILRVFPDEPAKLKRVQYEFTKLVGDQPIDIPEEGEVLDLEAEDD